MLKIPEDLKNRSILNWASSKNLESESKLRLDQNSCRHHRFTAWAAILCPTAAKFICPEIGAAQQWWLPELLLDPPMHGHAEKLQIKLL